MVGKEDLEVDMPLMDLGPTGPDAVYESLRRSFGLKTEDLKSFLDLKRLMSGG